MKKVLPGISHASLGFIRQHWQGLAQASVLPVLVIAVLAFVQLRSLYGLFEFILTQAANAKMQDANAMAPQFVSVIVVADSASLLMAVVFVWLFVRVTNFWHSGAVVTFGLSPGEVTATLMTLVYLLGIYLLTIAAYVGGVLALALIGVVGYLLLSNSVLVVIGTVVFFVAAFVGLVVLLVFPSRFLVGLPSVAMGQSPDFFGQLWPLAKGESFALPLRMMFWSFVFAIPIWLAAGVAVLFYLPDLAGLFELSQSAPPDPALIVALIKPLMPLQLIWILFQIPVIWFFSILLAEAHVRLESRANNTNRLVGEKP